MKITVSDWTSPLKNPRYREKLKPVARIEMVTPRVCATCASGRINNGTFECIRNGGYQTDCGDMEHWFHVCKLYKRQQ